MSIQNDIKRILGSRMGSHNLLRRASATTSQTGASVLPAGGIITLEKARENLQSLLVKQNLQYLVLASITLFAGFLRFFKLGEWSFWYDEIFTLRSVSEIANTSFYQIPVSRALISVALNLLGTGEWSARLVPALVGILTIPILYFPVKKIFGPPVGLLSCLFLAVSPWHLYWSQNARFYTTLLLFYTLALFLFYFAIERRNLGFLAISMLLAGLAILERLFALFLVPVMVSYLFFLKILPFEKLNWLRWRHFLIICFLGLAGGIFFGWEFIQDQSKWLEGFGWVNNNPLWLLAGVGYYVTIPVILMGSVGALYLLLKKERISLLLTLSAFLPLLGVMAISLVQYSANRYIFISLTSWIILASVAVYQLYQNTQGLAKVLVVGLLLILVIEPLGEDFLYNRYQHGNRDNWKAAFELVNSNLEPGDKVLVTSPELGEYYAPEKTMAIGAVELESLESTKHRVWIVEDMNLENKFPIKKKWIVENAQLIADFDVAVRARIFTMRVYLYDPEQRQDDP